MNQGDIVLRNNTSGNAPSRTTTNRSIFLEKNIYVEFQGAQHVYLEDGFDSGATINDGNNRMELAFDPDGSGFVQFGTQSDSMFSQSARPGGSVVVNSGQFRIASQQYSARKRHWPTFRTVFSVLTGPVRPSRSTKAVA